MSTDDRSRPSHETDPNTTLPIQDLNQTDLDATRAGEVKGGAGSGATVGKANFDVFTSPKGIDTATNT